MLGTQIVIQPNKQEAIGIDNPRRIIYIGGKGDYFGRSKVGKIVLSMLVDSLDGFFLFRKVCKSLVYFYK